MEDKINHLATLCEGFLDSSVNIENAWKKYGVCINKLIGVYCAADDVEMLYTKSKFTVDFSERSSTFIDACVEDFEENWGLYDDYPKAGDNNPLVKFAAYLKCTRKVHSNFEYPCPILQKEDDVDDDFI